MDKKIESNNLKSEVLAGKIFIYPTDTIYGLGCNALDEQAVNKIREIKLRDDKPLSIIAPSTNWILENFITTSDEINKYLPGPYTLLLKKKDPNFLIWISNNDRIGIRIPDHPFTKEIQKIDVPFVTTSVNLAGEPFAKSIDEIKQEIIEKVHFIVNIGKLNGQPSKLIIDGKEIIRR
jgi:L-threonylcarbamoyladenylate synthase